MGADRAPQTSHEGGTVKALPYRCSAAIWTGSRIASSANVPETSSVASQAGSRCRIGHSRPGRSSFSVSAPNASTRSPSTISCASPASSGPRNFASSPGRMSSPGAMTLSAAASKAPRAGTGWRHYPHCSSISAKGTPSVRTRSTTQGSERRRHDADNRRSPGAPASRGARQGNRQGQAGPCHPVDTALPCAAARRALQA